MGDVNLVWPSETDSPLENPSNALQDRGTGVEGKLITAAAGGGAREGVDGVGRGEVGARDMDWERERKIVLERERDVYHRVEEVVAGLAAVMREACEAEKEVWLFVDLLGREGERVEDELKEVVE